MGWEEYLESRIGPRTVWEEFAELQDVDYENKTAVLLEHFGCPMYSDEHGIEGSETEAYARIPDSSEAWNLFEDAYFATFGMDRPDPRISQENARRSGSSESATFD